MPAVPPTTRMHPSLVISALLEPLPGIDPAIGMPRRRLRRLGLDPSHAAAAGVEEAVGRADPGEGDIAGPEGDRLAVEDTLDRAGEEEVDRLEGVGVDL